MFTIFLACTSPDTESRPWDELDAAAVSADSAPADSPSDDSSDDSPADTTLEFDIPCTVEDEQRFSFPITEEAGYIQVQFTNVSNGRAGLAV